MAQAGLAALASVDAAGLTAAEQADCLRALERAEAMHTAARARVLAAFQAGCGFQDDGHGSAKTWLAWQTRTTRAAAGAALAWMRRLAAHPAVAGALAAGDISPSWARQVCAWTDLLPAGCRADADAILLAAAAGGAGLAGLAQLAEEMRRRTARPDTDGDDGFTGRGVRLDVTFGQAGKLEGDLTPQCTAALSAVLDALGKRAGPEDLRSPRQRRHDALEEACRRLLAAGCVPARAGQPAQIQLHMTLDQLRGRDPGGAAAGRRRGRPPRPAPTATPRSSRSSPATSTTSSSTTSPPPSCATAPASPAPPASPARPTIRHIRAARNRGPARRLPHPPRRPARNRPARNRRARRGRRGRAAEPGG